MAGSYRLLIGEAEVGDCLEQKVKLCFRQWPLNFAESREKGLVLFYLFILGKLTLFLALRTPFCLFFG